MNYSTLCSCRGEVKGQLPLKTQAAGIGDLVRAAEVTHVYKEWQQGSCVQAVYLEWQGSAVHSGQPAEQRCPCSGFVSPEYPGAGE